MFRHKLTTTKRICLQALDVFLFLSLSLCYPTPHLTLNCFFFSRIPFNSLENPSRQTPLLPLPGYRLWPAPAMLRRSLPASLRPPL